MPFGKRGRKYAGAMARNRYFMSQQPGRVKRARYSTRDVKGRFMASRALSGVRRLNSMIETKEITRKTAANVGLAHNKVHNVADVSGGNLNIFRIAIGASDYMEPGDYPNRIGDKISVKGVKVMAFFENSIDRSKVHYRFLLLKCAKGDQPTLATLFKGDSGNKMIDQINTERYSIVWSKRFNIQQSNPGSSSVSVAGVPTSDGALGGQGTRVIKAWIPGKKFGRYGNVQYENNSSQPKFFDYQFVIVPYDWYGSPSGIVDTNVGKLNEMYTKVYFKDA